jgi:hypothetical protein
VGFLDLGAVHIRRLAAFIWKDPSPPQTFFFVGLLFSFTNYKPLDPKDDFSE